MSKTMPASGTEAFCSHAFCIGTDHPALPGHFPGRPLVPGVLLLDEVARALRAWRGQGVASVPEVKFLAPLLPAQTAQVELRGNGPGYRFVVTRAGDVLARGRIEARP